MPTVVFFCLPTAHGKSLIYELLPFIGTGYLVTVIVPLNAIMEQQVGKLAGKCIAISPGKYVAKDFKNWKLSLYI